MTVGELQGWLEDNVRIKGGLKQTDVLCVNDDRNVSIIRDKKCIGIINFKTGEIEAKSGTQTK